MAHAKVTVIGIGQTLRGDDAAGIEAVQQWEAKHAVTASRPDVSVQYSELPGLALLDMLEGFEAAVIVDAVQDVGAAGGIFQLGTEELAAFDTGAKSAHGWGVAETLELGRQVGTLGPHLRIRLIGISAEQMDTGKPLSQAVSQALTAACEAIEAEVQAALG